MGFSHADTYTVGEREAKCPQCGGSRFVETAVGPLKYAVRGKEVELSWKATGKGYLCATVGCGRPWTITDLKRQEFDEGRGPAPADLS
jgi:hypothetical protein